MARYIDADKLDTRPRGNNSQRTMWREIKYIVDNAPTADVAPKSEVERLQSEVDRLKKDNEYILMQHRFQRRPSGDCWNDVIEKSKSEVAAKIFAEIEKNECHDISGKTTMYMLFAEEFAELKKKYGVTDTNVSHKQTEGKT